MDKLKQLLTTEKQNSWFKVITANLSPTTSKISGGTREDLVDDIKHQLTGLENRPPHAPVISSLKQCQ